MSWLSQVRHVLAKDVRQWWWLIAAHVAVVILTTMRSTSWRAIEVEPLGDTVVLVVLTAMLMLAFVLHGDSPRRIDAFWAAHPLRPSAVAGAKIALALALIVMGAVGQLIALGALQMEIGTTLPLTLESAREYGKWLLLALMLAALVDDVRSFALVLLGLPVLSLLLGLLAGAQGIALSEPVLHIAGLDLVAVPLGVGLILWMYQRRDLHLRARLAGALLAIVVTLVIFVPSSGDASTLPSAAPVGRFSLEPPEKNFSASRSDLYVRVRSDEQPTNARIAIVPRQLDVTLDDGSVVVLEGDGDAATQLSSDFTTALPPDRAAWSVIALREQFTANLRFEPGPSARRAMARGTRRIVLTGAAVIIEPRVLAILPLVSGADTLIDGTYVRVDRWEDGLEDQSLEVTAKVIRDPRRIDASAFLRGSALRFALLNERRGEVLPLVSGAGSASYGVLVIPGVSVRSTTSELSPVPPSGSARWDRDSWLRDAVLLVLAHDVRGSHPIRLELDLP